MILRVDECVRYTGRELFQRHEISRDHLQAVEAGAGQHPT